MGGHDSPTRIPYPYFTSCNDNSKNLSAVGRCRVDVVAYGEAFAVVLTKCVERAVLDSSDTDAKKQAKKLMKEATALAFELLSGVVDVSISDVEVVLTEEHVLKTQGHIVSCLLDAGAQSIVLPYTDNTLALLDLIGAPSERVIIHSESVVAETALEPLVGKVDAVSFWLNYSPITDEYNLLKDSLEPFAKSFTRFIFCIKDLKNFVGLEEIVHHFSQKVDTDVILTDPDHTQLGLSYAACARTDREDGLFTTVVCTRSGEALGLVYSSKESVAAALECGRGVYYSRSRKGLWRKGDTSGHYQVLHRLDIDCDADALRFTVSQLGEDVAAFCHLNTLTCWGKARGLRHLEETLASRLKTAPEGSYTKRLFEDDELLRNKLVEEAQELSEAESKQHIAEELADVIYFAMVKAAKAGVSIDDAAVELDKRSRKVTRRPGNSKDYRIAAGNEILNKK